ncbi:B2 protein-like [Oryza glaberrima]|uniref:DCD domain-containing protein n=3 Tax=Oryza TaxID=4527 RepID=A0A0D3GBL7_9ORYZ|nr:B2 protein-like [Oryza glaberrima]
MEGYDEREFWQFSDQLRLHNFSSLSIADSIWSSPSPAAVDHSSNKLAFANNSNNNLAAQQQHLLNNATAKTYFNKSVGRPANNNFNFNYNSNSVVVDAFNGKKKAAVDAPAGGGGGGRNNNKKNSSSNDNKMSSRLKKSQLPASESVPKEEAIGGYIFVCNNETMEENLKRQLFGLPSRYRDSVRAIRPGLPLFLYNYSTHQLHGIFEATSFGGSNIDPGAWEDSKCPGGESRFPAQVRVATRKICEPLEEDAFRPVLHHYDGPKFRLELTVAEALSLLDIFAEKLFA